MLFDPHFFMHKSMVGSLFTEARSVTVVVFMRENAQRSEFSIRAVIRQNRLYDRPSSSSRPICDVAARTRQLLSIYSSIVSQMSING